MTDFHFDCTTLRVYLASLGNCSSSYLKIFSRIGCMLLVKVCDVNNQHFRVSCPSLLIFCVCVCMMGYFLNLKSDFSPTGTDFHIQKESCIKFVDGKHSLLYFKAEI